MKKVLAGLLLAAMAALYGCSGDGASSPATAVGKFVDAPVAGLQYESGSQKGVTGADGSFTYEVGKPVKFFIGDIVLGEAIGQAVMTPITLAPAGSDESTPEVLARVQLLMSLSSTDPATGIITIPPATLTAAKGKTINFTASTDLPSVVDQLITGKTLVTADVAKAHFTASLEKLKTPTTPTTTAGFTSAMISGKSFTDSSNGGPVTFNANGSFVSSNSSATNKTWTINNSGQILVNNTGDNGTGVSTVTFISVDANNKINYSVKNSDGTVQTGTLTPVTTPPTTSTDKPVYALYTGWQPYTNGGKTLDSLLATNTYNGPTVGLDTVPGYGTSSSGTLGVQFDTTGKAYFRTFSGSLPAPILNATSTWSYITLDSTQVSPSFNLTGAKAIVVDASPIHKPNLIFVVYNGVVIGGTAN